MFSKKIKEIISYVITCLYKLKSRPRCTFFEFFLRFLRIKKNRITFSSFCGDNCSCNPRAIFEYLFDKYGNTLEYVWNVTEKNTDIPMNIRNNAVLVRHESFKSSYYKATSAVWCFNHRNTKYFYKKSKQLYIQTWHGDIGFKKFEVGLPHTQESLSSPYMLKCLKDSAFTDLLLCGSDWGVRDKQKSFYGYKGEFLNVGYPRNDVLINNDKNYLKDKIRNRYGIPHDVNICLYAPTFRRGFSLVDMLFSDDCKFTTDLLASLKNLGGEWVIMVKYHPATLGCESEKDFFDGKTVFDASDYFDTADLLVAVDALITDYSSIAFDFALTKKPCWLYWEDVDSYVQKHGELSVKREELSFDIAYNKKELISAIINFDKDLYCRKTEKMLSGFGSKENGTACENVANEIIKFMQL